ncbi:NUDIX domain-containing protein [Kocuria sp. p3-SID1433]|nr:NUDIX domain-containing protein [Kocuria sp. p3-SID1433]
MRKRGTQKFMLVGGKLEPGETAERAAQREVAEEVGAVISQEDLQLLGRFHSPAANEADTWISSTVFTIDLDEQAQQLLPQAEIEELRPLDLRPEAVAEAEAALAPLVRRQVIPLLRRRDRRFFSAGQR